MGILRFPSEVTQNNQPFCNFLIYQPQYDAAGGLTRTEINAGVCLYVPMNHSISDSLAYDTHQGGTAESILRGFYSEFDGDSGALQAFGDQAKQVLAGGLDAVMPGSSPKAMASRTAGRVINPNEFTLFRAPQLREFTFNFELMPTSQKEAQAITDIIRTFREAAYPVLSGAGFSYTVPKQFLITIQSGAIIQIPDCALTNIQVTYNPSAIAYFDDSNNTPVKTNLALTFKEVSQLTQEGIASGY